MYDTQIRSYQSLAMHADFLPSKFTLTYHYLLQAVSLNTVHLFHSSPVLLGPLLCQWSGHSSCQMQFSCRTEQLRYIHYIIITMIPNTMFIL